MHQHLTLCFSYSESGLDYDEYEFIEYDDLQYQGNKSHIQSLSTLEFYKDIEFVEHSSSSTRIERPLQKRYLSKQDKSSVSGSLENYRKISVVKSVRQFEAIVNRNLPDPIETVKQFALIKVCMPSQFSYTVII